MTKEEMEAKTKSDPTLVKTVAEDIPSKSASESA